MNTASYRPQLSAAGLAATRTAEVMDEYGELREVQLTGERPLTLYVDKREVVTLMTLGGQPELLALGYLRNQGFVRDLAAIESVQVDWDVDSVAITTRAGINDWEEKLSTRTVTTGCGQGTVFGRMMDHLDGLQVTPPVISQGRLYALLTALADHNAIYRQAGAVHACALCRDDQVLSFVEDVGRHNAADAIAGHMWLEDIDGQDKIFYTTGRLTSEMVIKVAQMGVPILLSRSGVTQMGLDIARRIGVVLIARAKGRHFLVYNGASHVELDARPPERPGVHLEAAQ
ncbi:MAG: formate dehydrogenase accessory sulfurtransferase FdhD [Gammaproteobacteria bacterium]|jgi:FdhD protein